MTSLILNNRSLYFLPSDTGRTVIPFAGSRKRLNSDNSDKAGSLDRGSSIGFFNPGLETSPPPSLMYAQSPPNMEGPITFVAPELAEETLMDVSLDHIKI